MTIQYVDPFGNFRFLRLMFLWRGGIFQVMWLELLVALSLVTATIGIAYAATQDKPEDWIFPAHIRSLSGVLAFVATRFQAAIGLMLGFYTATCFGRFTKVQQMEGNIQRIINKTSLRILYKTKEGSNDVFTSDEIRNIRTELVRLINLSHALAIRQVYEGTSKGGDQSLTYGSLLASGLLTEKERAWFIDNERSDLRVIEYVAPLAWFQDNINSLVKKEAFQFNPFTVEEFGSTILALQEALDDLVFSVAEPVPLIYTQLVQIVVRLYLVLLLLDSILYECRNPSKSPRGS
mmetsp:Transcript_26062/g.42364  ORF Transcript_26062/g.42364 Transcript_26062/m.42364 type:complete len:292 (+) Transcript_26062:278-1153(+)